MSLKPSNRVRALSADEEAALRAQIANNPDSREASDDDLARMMPARHVLPPTLFKAMVKRGRPKSENKRVQVTLRVDPAVLGTYKATGRGWQTRMNDALASGASRIRPTRPLANEVEREEADVRAPIAEGEREFTRRVGSRKPRAVSKPKGSKERA